MTEGEYRVGIDFNPSSDDLVGQLKRAGADLIDMIRDMPIPMMGADTTPEQDWGRWIVRQEEVCRLRDRAIDQIEDAMMVAVKAATKPLPKTEN